MDTLKQESITMDSLSLRPNIRRLAESIDGGIGLTESAIDEINNFASGFIHLLFSQTWPSREDNRMIMDFTLIKDVVNGLFPSEEFDQVNRYVRQFWNESLFGPVKNSTFDPNAQRYLGLVLEYLLYDWMRVAAALAQPNDREIDAEQVSQAQRDDEVPQFVRNIAARISDSSSRGSSDQRKSVSFARGRSRRRSQSSGPFTRPSAAQPSPMAKEVTVDNTLAILDPDQLAAYFIALIERTERELGEEILSEDGRETIRDLISGDLFDDGVLMSSDWFTSVIVPSPRSYEVTAEDEEIILRRQ